MREVISRIAKGVDIPLMIDSTQIKTIRKGLNRAGAGPLSTVPTSKRGAEI